MSTKLCYKCKVEKIYDDFYKDSGGKYGLSSKCKVCSCKTFKEYYEKNKKYCKQYSNQDIVCDDCFNHYKKSAKIAHYKTRKHKYQVEKIEKMTNIEGILEKK